MYGLFDQRGLDVSIVSTGGDEKTWAAVLSGDAQFGVGDPTFVAISDSRGQPGIVIASIVNGVPFWGITFDHKIPLINRPDQLNDFSVATFPSPSTAYTLQKKMFIEGGHAPNIREGAFGTLMPMLRARVADIALELEPNVSQAVAQGARVVYSLARFYGDFAITGLSITPSFLANNPEAVFQTVCAIQTALDLVKTQPDRVLLILQKRFPDISPAAAQAALVCRPRIRLRTKCSWTLPPKHSRIAFAICDPTRVLAASLLDTALSVTGDPVILAGLITNAAFWAVDRRSRRLIYLQDLAKFSRIICYGQGTTSYGIANRIFMRAGRTPSLLPVEPGQEFSALIRNTDVVAISPDILSADELAYNNNAFHVDMVLSTTLEYHNVLVTGILSRRDVVEQHPQLVQGLFTAIQRAAIAVRLSAPDVVDFAARFFSSTPERIESALQQANDALVFAGNIDVSEAHWLRAAESFCDAHQIPFSLTVKGHAKMPMRKSSHRTGDLHNRLSERYLVKLYRHVHPIASLVLGRL